MTTWITQFEAPEGPGPRLAVKTNIDVEGAVTTCGCLAFADEREPATADAVVVQRARAAGAVVVGTTVCDELGLGATGTNESYGTPTNPRAPELITGGSSSGSAVAVAADEADVAFGTDAGGSCRIPPACCGIAGLKTTLDRLSSVGVTLPPLAMDSVGILAPDVAGLVTGMRLVEPDFQPAPTGGLRIGRLRISDLGGEIDPEIDAAVDAALGAAGLDVVPVRLDGWQAAYEAGGVLLLAGAWREHADLLDHPGLTEWVANGIRVGGMIDSDRLAQAEATRTIFRSALATLFDEVDVLALPTLPTHPPRVDDDRRTSDVTVSRLTLPLNLAGVPAVTLPIPTGSDTMASLQLVTPHFTEERALAVGLAVEAAIGR